MSILIPLEKLRISPFNIRAEMGFGDEEDEELVENVKSEGVKDELIVRPVGDVYEVVRGRRRFLSAKQSGVVKEVPCIVREMTDEEALDNSLMEVIFRKDVDPVSLGKAIKKGLEMSGKSLRSYAKKIGKSPSTVSEWMKILELTEEVKNKVSKGEISFRNAVKIARLEQEEQVRFTQLLRERGQSYFDREYKRRMKGKTHGGTPKGLLIVRINFGKESTKYERLKRLAEEKDIPMGEYCKRILLKNIPEVD